MQVLVLPKKANNQLLRELSKCQNSRDFQTFSHRLGLSLRSTKLQSPVNSRALLFLLNRVILTNIYKYVEEGANSHFLYCVSNKLIVHDFYVNNYYICDFVKEMMGSGVQDYEHAAIENSVCKEIMCFITYIYTQASETFNEAFLALYEMLYTYIPSSAVNVKRFELSPELDPIVFCTAKPKPPEFFNNESLCNQ